MLGCTCVKLSRVVTDAVFGAGGAWFASSLPTFEREETLPRWKSLANATENLAMCIARGRGSWAVLPKAVWLTSFVTSQLSVASPTGDLGLLPRSVCQAFTVCASSYVLAACESHQISNPTIHLTAFNKPQYHLFQSLIFRDKHPCVCTF